MKFKKASLLLCTLMLFASVAAVAGATPGKGGEKAKRRAKAVPTVKKAIVLPVTIEPEMTEHEHMAGEQCCMNCKCYRVLSHCEPSCMEIPEGETLKVPAGVVELEGGEIFFERLTKLLAATSSIVDKQCVALCQHKNPVTAAAPTETEKKPAKSAAPHKH